MSRPLPSTVRALAAGLLAVACAEPPTAVPPPPRALDLGFAGCAAMHQGEGGRRCLVSGATTLRVWLDAPGAVHAGAIPVEITELAGGRRLSLTVPAGAAEVVVTVGEPTRGRWRLLVGPLRVCPAVDAAAAKRARDPAAALAALEAADAGECAARAHSLRGRLLGDLGRAEEGEAALAAAMAAHEAAGRLTEALADRLALAYAAIHRHRDFARARALLDGPERLPGEGEVMRAHFRALRALEAGDLRAALRSAAEAIPIAERLDAPRWRAFLEQTRARALHRMGRRDEALRALDALRARGVELPPCEAALIGVNLGWLRLIERERGGAGPDPEPPLREAAAIYTEACPRPFPRANVELNLALAALQRADPAAARDHLARARALQPEPDAHLRDWWRDLDARIAAAEGREADALAVWAETLRALGDGHHWSPETLLSRWRAHLGRGQILERLGRLDEAAAAYAAAEEHLEAEQGLLPIDEGRGSFLRDRAESARRLVDVRLRLGRPALAADAARRARARALAALRGAGRLGDLDPTTRARWEAELGRFQRLRAALQANERAQRTAAADALPALTAEAARLEGQARAALDAAYAALALRRPAPPPTPTPGELRLVFHPLPGDALAGFAVTADGAAGHRFEVGAEARPGKLLEPFRAEIGRAERLVLLPHGALVRVDFHRLPWGDGALIDAVPVAYGLDLPAPTGGDGQGALVVADPRGDLAAARAAAGRVAERLAEGGAVRVLRQREATRDAVLPALEGTALFHFAGHGRFAGREGWESTLSLARGGQLDVGDVLALRRPPAQVLLSACESGRTDVAAAATLGLAQAFVVAGSRAVVATSRPVEDALAAEVSVALHDDGLRDAARSLRRVQRALLRTRPAADWAAWRVWIP